MPKNKTKTGAAKRFRITGTGKIMRRRANRMHLLEHKPSTRTRRLDGMQQLSSADRARVRSMLGK